MSDLFFYTLFYVLITGCILYPPIEFVAAGLTIKDIFSDFLGDENEFFIHYHIRRSVFTLFIHSMFPLDYIIGLSFSDNFDFGKLLDSDKMTLGLVAVIFALVGAWYTVIQICEWYIHDWAVHPIVQNLSVYSNNNMSWQDVAADINREYRRVDKTDIVTNGITRIVVTDNWIIKITSYKLQVVHQSDATLIVKKCDTHLMSAITGDQVQYINIQVKSMRATAEGFDIRLNALDFKDLQDKVSRPIIIPQNITFHKTLLDRFISTFKEEANKNPIYDTAQELDQCVGCMQVTANMKLNKLCDNVTENRDSDGCTVCYCRPMWCIECMAKWFASRQDKNAPETWLSAKCTCPVCKAKFCILDVCNIRILDQ
ncbi:PREDICTED: E3 ubiquitin-protein ligase TM129 [Dinoponera quadriceps]|uniref:E3 ubiquitin-protein ligase TM129 n=1 Tax=Dinoponera quadriceps TaxID=609295 RepID=A0A6P3XV92_DINQU|nr:PREDICTED: E3 ubiquitin-protein ligase TM129 [Dinoponera quadriceps]